MGEVFDHVKGGGPHEWGYRCLVSGTFIADDWPFKAADELDRLTAENARLRAKLELTPENVERVARVLRDANSEYLGIDMGSWENSTADNRLNWICIATAAIKALGADQ